MIQKRIVTVRTVTCVTTGGPWIENMEERWQSFFLPSRKDIGVSVHHGHLYFVKWPARDDDATSVKPGKRYIKTPDSDTLYEIVYTYRISQL